MNNKNKQQIQKNSKKTELFNTHQTTNIPQQKNNNFQ